METFCGINGFEFPVRNRGSGGWRQLIGEYWLRYQTLRECPAWDHLVR